MSDRDPVLSVRDLQIRFASEAGPVHAVRGVSFDLYAGQTLSLVGESGSGKSAVASGIIGLLPDAAAVTGEVRLDGQQLVGLPDKQMSALRGSQIGMVFQDPLSALTPIFTVGRQLSDAVRVHQRIGKDAAWRRAVELLDLVGIPDPVRRADSFPHELSGGMRQRVVIALAIANDPAVIVADEPTTALDVTVQAQILDVLGTAQRETGAALLLITHDLGVVAGQADEVAVMYAGRIVEQAPVDDLFARPTMPYTAGLLAALPRIDAPTGSPLSSIDGDPPTLLAEPLGCPFAARCPAAEAACSTAEPPLLPTQDEHLVACARTHEILQGSLNPAALFPAVESDGHAVSDATGSALTVRGLTKTFPIRKGRVVRRAVGSLTAVDQVDLDLARGETLALVGESGSGKTTTLLELLRLAAPEQGSIEVLGHAVDADLDRRTKAELRRSLQIVMQDPTGALDPRLPVFDLLAEPLQAARYSRNAIRERVSTLLDLVGLDQTSADRFPSAFSGGQRQRIGIARALATEPQVVVLDEPVSALDVSVQASILNLLSQLQRRLGLSYLLVAHDLSVVRHIADRVAVMYLGRIVETASTSELFAHPRHPYTRALLSAIPVPDPQRERERERIVLTGEATHQDGAGCPFAGRCPVFLTLGEQDQQRCRSPQSLAGGEAEPDHLVACHVAMRSTSTHDHEHV
ncbi:ABC transporter ATP-binding protein [Luteipulveratus mongoliensis]|uniref:Peptide ABC transporter ATP-binding protein n=1 Tax=Luteipulveratus mongoliensis TaxID=571913 RepID=A0A0K1JEX6_9MICO|nr:ABC transporter ATP-binding protein [Luteipulveratus mongoliensis]AKU15267.1 peptide ABC transporter ATP-binding protein [Luteipulveratus mongoliensis]